MTTVSYVDASALVKLVVDEAESPALLRWYVEAERLVTSRVGVVETVRASSRRDHDPARRARVITDVEVYRAGRRHRERRGRAASARPPDAGRDPPGYGDGARSRAGRLRDLRRSPGRGGGGDRAAGGAAGLTQGLSGVGIASVARVEARWLQPVSTAAIVRRRDPNGTSGSRTTSVLVTPAGECSPRSQASSASGGSGQRASKLARRRRIACSTSDDQRQAMTWVTLRQPRGPTPARSPMLPARYWRLALYAPAVSWRFGKRVRFSMWNRFSRSQASRSARPANW